MERTYPRSAWRTVAAGMAAAATSQRASAQAADDAPGTFAEEAAEFADYATDVAAESIFRTLETITQNFLAHLPLIAAGLLILLVTWIAAKIVGRLSGRALRRTKLRGSLQDLVSRFIDIGIWSLGLILAAMVVFPGLTPSKALAGLGIGSLAIGFAFKDIFENFFAGVLILWRFPFEKGDFIECEDITGKVEDVTIRNTMIRRVSGELVVIPNSTIFKNPVDILTNLRHRRVTIMAGVAYGEDVDQSRDVIIKSVQACKTVHQDMPVEIFANQFGSSSIDFEVTWWCSPTPLEIRRSRDEVVAAVKRGLDDAGIEIPFPYRTLTFKEALHTRVEQEE